MEKLNKSNEWYLMETAMLECSIKEGIDINSLTIVHSKKKNAYYIVDRKSYILEDCKTKIWFKKTF